MITIGIFEAKASLGQLAQSAAEGEVIVLTRRGKPVAEIRSPEGDSAQANTQQAIDDLRKFRRSIRVGRFELADLVAEGRR
jgi:prevent-host-death family protein